MLTLPALARGAGVGEVARPPPLLMMMGLLMAGLLLLSATSGLEVSKKGNAEDWERECVLCGVRFGPEARECWRECRERREWRSWAGEAAREESRRMDLSGRGARAWEERRAAFVFVLLRRGERAGREIALSLALALVSRMGVIFPSEYVEDTFSLPPCSRAR